MADVFDLVAKITLDSSEYEKELSKQADNADKGSGVVGKLKSGLGSVGKAGAAAFGVVSAAAVAATSVIVKSAVSGYAEYEQLSGGVQKLFGEDASKQVMKYAENAYKTAGMSANEYMETATSFSASLIQSLGGDTARAADVADIAMQSMSDNVNTFGGDIESVKTAYQGFAKQNYTMLDNLKLGYGGTKSEMERLIKDANKYRKAQGKNADLTVDSFADIVEAIQTVQEEQGIAGTTAKEAMTTIEGSASATKAAWKNVTTAIAGGGDLKKAMKGLTESIFGTGGDTGLLNQVIPRVQTAFEGLADFIGQAAPLFAKKLPELVTAILPSALSAVGSVVKALASALPGLLKSIWDAVKGVAPTLIETIKGLATGIPGALSGIITGIGNWITTNATSLGTKGGEIWSAIVSGISGAIDSIGDALSGIGQAILDWINNDGATSLDDDGIALWEKIKNGFTNALDDIGQLVMKIIVGIGTWITTNYDSIAQAGKNLLSYIVEGISAVASDIAIGLLDMIKAAGTWVVNNYQTIFAVGKQILGYIIEGIVEAVKTIAKGFVDFIKNVGQWFTDNSGDITAFGHDVIDFITDGIGEWISNIKDGFVNLVSTISEKISTTSFLSIGSSIIRKIKDAIVTFLANIGLGFVTLPTKIKDKTDSLSFSTVAKSIIDGIKSSFDVREGSLADKLIQMIQGAVDRAGAHQYKTTVHVSTSGNLAGGGGGKFAKAKNAPYLFTKGTVFGRYNGEDLIAGEAGPEMLLGVNKLNAMLYQSVQGGMQSMMGQMQDMMFSMQGGGSVRLQQEIINVLNAYLPQMARQQIVLDTGAIAGAVAPGVDSALGGTASNKRRYAAS